MVRASITGIFTTGKSERQAISHIYAYFALVIVILEQFARKFEEKNVICNIAILRALLLAFIFMIFVLVSRKTLIRTIKF